MLEKKRTYDYELIFNQRKLSQVIISSHYEKKHKEVNDEIILELVKQLDGERMEERKRTNNWKYFDFEPLFFQSKAYRLVWCLPDNHNFLGVINCFRRKKYEKKK